MMPPQLASTNTQIRMSNGPVRMESMLEECLNANNRQGMYLEASCWPRVICVRGG